MSYVHFVVKDPPFGVAGVSVPEHIIENARRTIKQASNLKQIKDPLLYILMLEPEQVKISGKVNSYCSFRLLMFVKSEEPWAVEIVKWSEGNGDAGQICRATIPTPGNPTKGKKGKK